MGKADRNRKQSARERIAAQQAAARRAEARRRTIIAGGSILAVIAVVVVFVVIHAATGTSAGPSARTPLPASVARNVTGVPAATLTAVGSGSVPKYSPKPITAITGQPLVQNGKPEMLYIGAEFCPYCAAMRWSMAVALSRFGTLSTPLRGIHSAPSPELFPNTATLTFYQSSYSSKYLSFIPVENEKISRATLQPTTSQQDQIWHRYEPGGQRGYPFIDFGNKFVLTAPIYDPSVLAGKTWAQIAAALHDPASPIAQGANGAANYITAAICKITSNQPANVCSAPPISTLEAQL